MVEVNGSFASPAADASVVTQFANPTGALYSFVSGLTIWSGLLYLLLAAIVYDQGLLESNIDLIACTFMI